ncbi:MAG: acylphosphatase [Candidatus Heimdallarchaeota archaeon]|nr:MAG: acylphosphatase [Candidatus Heimdallarchaeota archaeon]
MKRVRIYVTGRVQGVFFRVYTRDMARQLAICGYVRNLPDGRVEIVAEGTEDSLRKIATWAKNEGSPYSRIASTKEVWEDIEKPQFSDFQITY